MVDQKDLMNLKGFATLKVTIHKGRFFLYCPYYRTIIGPRGFATLEEAEIYALEHYRGEYV